MCSNSLVFKRLDINSLNEQVQVYIEAFEHNDRSFDEMREHWKQKHYENPLGESYIFGAYEGDVLVGENCFLKMQYAYKDACLNILQSCESGVIKSHQRKGIWKKLMVYAISSIEEEGAIDAIIGFPNHKNSYPGFMKMGWKTLFMEKNMILPLNGEIMSQMYLGHHWWSVLGRLLNVMKAKVNRINTEGYTVEKIDKDIPSLSLQPERKNGISLVAEDAWLRWKINYNGIDAYCVAHNNEKMLVLSKTESLKGYYYIKLLGCLGGESLEDKQRAIAAFIKCVKRDGYPFIRAWSKTGTLFSNMGFLEMKKHKNPFIIHIVKRSNQYLETPSLWDPDLLDLD